MPGRTILVTNGLSDAGVYAAGELASAGYDVISADFGRLPFGIRSRFAREHHPVSERNAQEFAASFLDLIRRQRPAVLLPIGSRFVHAAIVYRSQIEATTAVNVPGLDAYFAAFDKRQCMAECLALGIPHPRVYPLAEAQQLLSEPHCPVTLVVKPDIDIGAACGVSYVRDGETLTQAFEQCTAAFGGALIQEYIPGGTDAMKSVTLLFAPDTRLTAAFTMQKLRQLPSEGGVTALGRSTLDENLVKQVLPFFERWQWRGGAEVELKLDARDGLHKVIEINPRFPGCLRFAAQCGLRMAEWAVTLALNGNAVPAIPYPGYADAVGYCSPGLMLESLLADRSKSSSASAILRAAAAELRLARPRFPGTLRDPLPMIGRVLHRLSGARGVPPIFHPHRPGSDR
jgi:D-aspartate ligase